jgi:predicted phage tail protein
MSDLIAGKGVGCFVGSTLVLTPSGNIEISKINEQDEVICFDEFGVLHVSKVLKVHVHEACDVYQYFVWGLGEIEATPNHWVLNQNNAFVEISRITEDSCLVDINGQLRPITNIVKTGSKKVYNLTVAKYHTYIANNICVHNGGGGKQGAYKPKTAKDSLNSSASIKILELIGEGEIEGFPSARNYSKESQEYYIAMQKDIFLDKTPMLSASANPSNPSPGDYNFRNATISARFGTNDQAYLPGFATAESEISVGVVVSKDTPITRTITDVNIDRVRVTLTFSALQKITDKGDIKGTSVEYSIQVSYNGGPFTTVISDKVSGRTGDAYQRDRVFPINGAFPVSVRVVRETKDSTNPKLQNEFSWTSFTEIVDAKLRYPNSAIVGIEVDAKDFNSIPSRSFRVRGLKVSIPKNATVDQNTGRLIYSGVWDGTFGAAVWCSDPCWCLWDLITECRYGLGHHIKQRDLDKWAFYKASVYCNELVSNGSGSLEPRFSCNVSIQNQEESYKVINDMCSVFRAMPYWSAGSLTIAQDAPSDSVFLFNQSNVTEEGFQYSGSSLRTRHTAAIVSYLNLDNQELDYVSIEDPEAIEKYGYFPVQISAFATTTRSQAYRVGEWLLYTEQYESETCSFKTAIDSGASVRPGQVVSISDPLRSGVKRGGRIVNGGSNFIVVDGYQDTDLPVTGTPKILVTLQDGTVATKDVASITGPKITISGTFASTPLVGGAYILNNSTMEASEWRIVGVEEEENGLYAITALAHNSSKYDYIERSRSLVFKDYLPQSLPKPSSPTSITSQYVNYIDEQGLPQTKLAVSWANDPYATNYELRYRLKTEE